MRQILSIVGLISCLIVDAQTIEDIDQLRADILQKLDQYECLEYVDDKTLNEDAHQYDTARFYRNVKGDLVYIRWYTRSHAYHIVGDAIDITELFFLDRQAVFYRNWGYSFKNSQWHKEPDINETKISISESIRRYFDKDGSTIMEYVGREAEGKYEDRFNLLDSIPLEEEERLIWTDRCDECIEEEYLSIYRELLKEKGE